jgi:hypothetical protein
VSIPETVNQVSVKAWIVRSSMITSGYDMIGRIISLIIGIAFLTYTVYMYNTITNAISQINHGIAVCNSTLGRLGSLIFHDRAQQCEQVSVQAPSLVAYGNIVYIVPGIIGGFCTAFGAAGLIQASRIYKAHV